MLCSFDKFVETGRDSRNCSKKFFLTNLDAMHCVLSEFVPSTNSGFIKRDFRVDFFKLAPSREFETSSRAVKKLNGATLILTQRYCKVHIAFL